MARPRCSTKFVSRLYLALLLFIPMTLLMLGSWTKRIEKQPPQDGWMHIEAIADGPNEKDNGTESIVAHFDPAVRNGQVLSAREKDAGIAKLDIPEGDLQAELNRRLKTATDRKVIVVWHTEFGNQFTTSVDAAPCGSCEITYDKSMINDPRTVAVVVHISEIKPASLPPLSTRNPQHLYIFWENESTSRIRQFNSWRKAFDIADRYGFNATMTYRRDSDFYMSYQYFDSLRNIARENTLTVEELLKLKTKTAVIVVSNCGVLPITQKRLQMVKEIKGLGFALEGYGKCLEGAKKFANSSDRQSEEFHREVGKYKFYFAFENSHHCKDYITEKFFNNALRSKTVPVVWGARKKDYEAFAPSGSFIFVEDFDSLKDLVKYLQYLDKNDTAYMEYLGWLEMNPSDLPSSDRAWGFCAICRALHGINVDDIYKPGYNATNPERPLFTDGVARRTVQSLKKWFYGTENHECFS